MLGAVVVATWMAIHGSAKDDIGVVMRFYYDLDFTLGEILHDYRFDVTC